LNQDITTGLLVKNNAVYISGSKYWNWYL
jgi:hypothetical protein